MCSSEIARVRAGGADYLEETSSVCVGEGCERERQRDRESERERDGGRGTNKVCVVNACDRTEDCQRERERWRERDQQGLCVRCVREN